MKEIWTAASVEPYAIHKVMHDKLPHVVHNLLGSGPDLTIVRAVSESCFRQAYDTYVRQGIKELGV